MLISMPSSFKLVQLPLNIFFLHRKQLTCSYNLIVHIAILLVFATILLAERTILLVVRT